ncbi:hypothetical protein D3H55_03500 [Bacillus salacetis]|uniref:Myb-like domain-containing protein n=1 Tax=Bacillus salacetis TaxID=2315464 RepID=A0A3A1R9J7_9BACI|nr:hypothetical protein [Bacillus salacetis]RIW37650.1 hypothetical protein D3H55_03500 [Bacillus salacetis]
MKWTEYEEKLLSEIVITYIQEGKTLKEAFEEAAYSIGRTTGACRFRWNKKMKKLKTDGDINWIPSQTLEDCISFLQSLCPENPVSENEQLKKEQEELIKALHAAERNYQDLREYYKNLLMPGI